MGKAAAISALLHASVILFVYFGLPSLFRTEPVLDQPVHVDVVMLDEIAKPKPAPAPEPEPPKAEALPPPPPEPPPEPEPPKVTAAPEPPPAPELEPPPEPAPEPEPVPKPEPKAQPKPEPEPEPEPQPKPEPKVAKPKPKPKQKPKPPPDQFQTLLKNLAQQREKAQREAEKTEEQEKTAQNVPPLPRVERPPQRNTFDQARAVAGLAQKVKQQVTPCWNIPGGAKGAGEMQIAVRITLNPDGTLRGPPRVENTARMTSDPFYRAMAESALRALRNPRCTPLQLPMEQYDLWKEITFNFDPSEALGP